MPDTDGLVIEGEAREVDEPRSLVVQEPRGLARAETPTAMIGLASELATALKDIVERQRLYAVIQGKKYPQVEAWMTIGRMDNVVAREVTGAILRRDDGAYEATVELVRLSDGMVVGRGSALCGTAGDKPWDTRGEPARRSMAVTRATSRAFRQQYSWIMALAGYEPTPADEMPQAPEPAPEAVDPDGGLIGTVEIGKAAAKTDYELRQTPDGYALGFRLTSARGGIKTLAFGYLAQELATYRAQIVGKRVTCWGRIDDETFRPTGSQKDVTYQVLTLERIRVPELGDLPTPEPPPAEPPLVGTLDAEAERELDAAIP